MLDIEADCEIEDDDADLLMSEQEAPEPAEAADAPLASAGTREKAAWSSRLQRPLGRVKEEEEDAGAGDVQYVQSLEWDYVLAPVKPSSDAGERQALHQRALASVDAKPVKMCNHLTCMVKKQGKHAWCAVHRNTYGNAKIDAARKNALDVPVLWPTQ